MGAALLSPAPAKVNSVRLRGADWAGSSGPRLMTKSELRRKNSLHVRRGAARSPTAAASSSSLMPGRSAAIAARFPA